MQRSELSIALIVCVAALSARVPIAAADDPENATAETVQASTPAAETSSAAKNNYNNRLICQSQTVIGSRIPRTTCATRSQIDARHASDEAWKRSLDSQRDRLPPPGGGVVSQ